MSKLTVIDFFCGAGGFSEGFRQVGFKILEGFDNWQPAINTYNYNFDTESKLTDILKFKDSLEEIDNLPDSDIIIGSPPCVSFSSSNKSGKADKSLGLDLTKCFLRIVAVKKHQKDSILKAWFMENVVNSKKYISEIYSFKDLDLTDWALENGKNPDSEALNLKDNTVIMNSADYGSYQARKRSISGEIIFFNKLIVPRKTHSNIAGDNLLNWNTLGELLQEIPPPNSNESDVVKNDPVYKSIMLKQKEITDHFYDSGLYRSEWRQSMEHKINHYCMGKMSFPENLNKPSRTITATKSGTSREALVYKSEYNREGNGEYRTPTIREAASIMGFPYTYQFLGSINSKWRLVGNAVCPSVSRSLANQVLLSLNKKAPKSLKLKKEIAFTDIVNLNDFKEKSFDKQPKRTKNSRFRRHPIKVGNLTVTLSNYEIEKKTKPNKKWFTSIQYGTGINFKNQVVQDNYYKDFEPLLIKNKSGKQFVRIINNGFSEKIADGLSLQEMYELQESKGNFKEPTELVHEVNVIIKNLNISNNTLKQREREIFVYKDEIPMEQLFALYAINKIASVANEKEKKNASNLIKQLPGK
ncbi:DNA cytosine methyltransferase [Polaribacter sp. MED152]|uniref:DNA cytosine methyltransferase n=1 Tax=Polaribacter sp. MED152 TaxID=313598 RepID=UPI000068CBE9|nr:DNA cytosine methyltransferase [Polaribacter sp. MED152]EAQ42525.1 DNA (cytosine-5-)-methyltransferase [Polaribacter sp. MED152]